MPAWTVYQQQIVNLILNINHFLINDVTDLEEIITVDYSQQNLDFVWAVLMTGNYGKLKTLEPVENLFGEAITVFLFRDENNSAYYAIVYDSGELEQKPMILEMARSVNK